MEGIVPGSKLLQVGWPLERELRDAITNAGFPSLSLYTLDLRSMTPSVFKRVLNVQYERTLQPSVPRGLG